MKIAIYNHTFQEHRYYKRWKMLADLHSDIDVTLLAPLNWTWGDNKELTYGTSFEQSGTVVDENNFHIKLVKIDEQKHLGWTSKSMCEELLKLKPDVFYFIGIHTQRFVSDVISLKKHKLPNTKIYVFSMRGPQHNLKLKLEHDLVANARHFLAYCVDYYHLVRLNKYCDAIFCHYPEAVRLFKKEGYNGPIYMQTQVGVDTDIFRENEESRQLIRRKYNIGDSYLFGSASRFHYSKGILEVIEALPEVGNWKYLLMGWGRDDEVQNVREAIQRRGLEDRVILTGYIDNWEEMSACWNAIDCAIHAPLSTESWVETFSLSLVQAMATGKPVIGSDSGSVPYQIGPEGIIVKEKDISAMKHEMLNLMNNPQKGVEIGAKMKQRAVECFSIKHLEELFYLTISDLEKGIVDPTKLDMTLFSTD